MHWFLDPVVKHYADFKGRATRQEFWMFTLVYMLLIVAFMVFMSISIFVEGGLFLMVMAILGLVTVLLFVPSVAITVRRLHDIGRSGWWWFLNFIPYVGGLIVIVMCCLPSQKGGNAYGANKLEPEAPMAQTQPETAQVA